MNVHRTYNRPTRGPFKYLNNSWSPFATKEAIISSVTNQLLKTLEKCCIAFDQSHCSILLTGTTIQVDVIRLNTFSKLARSAEILQISLKKCLKAPKNDKNWVKNGKFRHF